MTSLSTNRRRGRSRGAGYGDALGVLMAQHRDGANPDRAPSFRKFAAKGVLRRLFAKFRYGVGGNSDCRADTALTQNARLCQQLNGFARNEGMLYMLQD